MREVSLRGAVLVDEGAGVGKLLRRVVHLAQPAEGLGRLRLRHPEPRASAATGRAPAAFTGAAPRPARTPCARTAPCPAATPAARSPGARAGSRSAAVGSGDDARLGLRLGACAAGAGATRRDPGAAARTPASRPAPRRRGSRPRTARTSGAASAGQRARREHRGLGGEALRASARRSPRESSAARRASRR